MNADTESSIRAFRRTLRRLERHITSNLRENSLCCGVTPTQCHVLLRVEEEGETSIAGLTDFLGLDKSSLSRTVDGLVRLGLLERRESREDRRYTSIRLSDQGRRYLQRLNSVCDDYYTPVIEALPVEIRRRLGDDLEALSLALEENRPTTDGPCCSVEEFMNER